MPHVQEKESGEMNTGPEKQTKKPAAVNRKTRITVEQKYTDNTGERLVYRRLKLTGVIDGHRYQIRNLVLKCTCPFKMTEIDTVMLHTRGIFIFESKEMNGNIYGTAGGKWHYVPRDGKDFWFKNPLTQNRQHIEMLSGFLKQPAERFYSMVVFPREAWLHASALPLKKREYIVKRDKMTKTVKMILDQGRDVFSEEEVDAMYRKLSGE